MLTQILFALLCVVAVKTHSVGYRPIHNLNGNGRIENEYLIVLKEGEDGREKYVTDFKAKLKELPGEIKVIKTFAALRSPIIHIEAADEDVVRSAFSLPEVKFIEANSANMHAQQCGRDTVRTENWGLNRISTGQWPGDWTYSYQPGDGAGIRVYMLDTGLFLEHTFYHGRAEFGVNTIGGNDYDMNGHGTHCAGIAIGDVTGVSRGATAVGVKVLNDTGAGTTSSVVEGINWVIENLEEVGGRGVINLPSAGDPSEAVDSAVESAVASNIPVVVPAGNGNNDACNYSPARVASAITVGGIGRYSHLSGSSNWGSCIDILAASEALQSTLPCHTECVGFAQGTSQASAFAAGAVANYLTSHPSATPAEIKQLMIDDASEGFIDLRDTAGTPNLVLYQSCEGRP